MRVSIMDVFGDDCSTATPAVNAPVQKLDPNIANLLQPFLDQSAPVRSIVAVRCHEMLGMSSKELSTAPPVGPRQEIALLQLVADESSSSVSIAYCEGEHALDRLAQQARELSEPVSGNDLLVLPAHMLNELMTAPDQDFSFRAVAVVFQEIPGQLDRPGDWKLRRTLFDRGLICIGSVPVERGKALCFLASDAVCSFNHLHVESRGHIGMSVLLHGAAFGNQLFRYACVKLYALRHGLTPAFPAWEGNQLFGLEDKRCEGLELPELVYPGFADNDREIWEQDDPPINIDLKGYFQELPECWRRHRPLLRRLFQLPLEHREAIEAWRHSVTRGGRRTLVAVHVRRGDYRNFQGTPYFRLVPEDWYLEWLRAIWPTLRDPVLFVGTDEPDAILPMFQEFETVSATFGPEAPKLPDYIRDFEVMRRSDYLAMCNSSFGRMAAILAPPTQKCFLPSSQSQSFEPYAPWIDPAFWARFADPERPADLGSKPQTQVIPAVNDKNPCEVPSKLATILIDVSDLLLYLLNHATLSGIQRVECEILRNLLHTTPEKLIRFVVLNKRGELGEIETSALLAVLEDIRSGTASKADIKSKLHSLAGRLSPYTVRSREIFLAIGAFWNTRGMGTLLQKLKNSRAMIGLFIHDILPITAPEYFGVRDSRVFVKGITEAFAFADFILTTTEYNKASLAEHLASRKLDPLPIHLIPLGRGLSLSAPIEPKISSIVSEIVDTDYVLCVGTIEVRKNPAYLFNIWKMMASSGRSNIPRLVFAGRKGWLVQDFLDQLKACNYLGGRILVVHDATDVELDLLYRKCMLTMFPSFIEGWGLPVGESLAHGKICLCSSLGGIPEAGAKLVDYLDPYNACDGLEKLSRYLDNPDLRCSREREISERFHPRSWGDVADDLLRSVQALAKQMPLFDGVAAITLPRDLYLEISSDAAAKSVDGIDGALSAELICISGWHPAEKSGVRAAQAETMIRFRADAPAGTRINLIMRLAAVGRGFRVRIRPGSGDETELSLSSGSERLVVLPCEVEPGKLVTANLVSVGATLDEDESPGASYWMLKGLLYFDPKRVKNAALGELKNHHGRSSPAIDPSLPLSAKDPDRPEHASQDRILLHSAAMDDSRRATSFGGFLQTPDSYWPSRLKIERDAPIFADHADRRTFYSGCGNSHFPEVGRVTEDIKLVKRSDQFVSMSRFSEGSVFDRHGVWKAFGYLRSSPPGKALWASNEGDCVRVDAEALAAAHFYEHSYLIFYNGNLHNYYHWLVEGLLSLDILSRALGLDNNVKIALPKSTEIGAVFDHRESLRAVGLAGREIVEVEANLIKVREAIWIDSDQVQFIPAPYLKDFQQRIAAQYAGLRSPRNRRLLVARRGPVRKIHNIEQVQTFLSRYDFETVYLEGMSMMNQILLFQSAEVIIAPHGAGLANLLFCEPGTKVIELMPACEMRPFFWLISEKLDLVYGLQFCATVPEQDFRGAIAVDIDKLQALIRMVEAHF
jgi:glycosyltransferase involved in cell wall biosynthesis